MWCGWQPVGALDGVEAWSTNEVNNMLVTFGYAQCCKTCHLQVCSWVLNSGWGIWLKHFREAEIDGYELLRLTPGVCCAVCCSSVETCALISMCSEVNRAAGDLRIELGINNLNVSCASTPVALTDCTFVLGTQGDAEPDCSTTRLRITRCKMECYGRHA